MVVKHHLDKTPTIQASWGSFESRPLVLGPRLRLEMQHQIRLLTCEWGLTHSGARRREIARQVMAVATLLGSDIKMIGGEP